jgi:hypothetical protein
MAVKRTESKKFYSTNVLIGCSPSFLKEWLEYQFNSLMTWDNYGKYWDIDHVIPCSSFDMNDVQEQKTCFNWRNCRPYESTKNKIKHNKIIQFQLLLQELIVYNYEQHIQIAGNPLET